MSASGFDAHFGLRFSLRASTLTLVLDEPPSTSGFTSSFGRISDFELKGQRLLRRIRALTRAQSRASLRASAGAISIGLLGRRRHCGTAGGRRHRSPRRAGAKTGR